MAMDAVAIFAEGTVVEQVQELVNYLALSVPDEERQSFTAPFQSIIKTDGDSNNIQPQQLKSVFKLILHTMKDLGPGTDREIEGFVNLLLSHVLQQFSSSPSDLSESISRLLEIIAQSPSADHLAVKYRILSNIFNSLPRESPLRLQVYSELLRLATANDNLEVLQLSHAPVQRWMDEWDVSLEQKSKFLKSVADAVVASGAEQDSYKYLLQHLKILPSSSSQSKTAALETIAAALRIPTLYQFDDLLQIEAVIALKGEPLLSLLKIFSSGNVQDYVSFRESHQSILDEHKLSDADLCRKIRSLTMASLGSSNIGKDLSYATICSTLMVEENEVDQCIIDMIHSGLVSGKLSQSQRTFRVTRSTTRAFGTAEWEALEKRLLVWKTGLIGVLDVVAATRKTTPIAILAGDSVAQ